MHRRKECHVRLICQTETTSVEREKAPLSASTVQKAHHNTLYTVAPGTNIMHRHAKLNNDVVVTSPHTGLCLARVCLCVPVHR